MAERLKGKDPRTVITNIYISIMLLLFPLFTGFSGYSSITFPKYLFFVIATGLWLIALIIVSLVKKLRLPCFALQHWAALGFGCVCIFSFALSPFKCESLIGASRYDGLVTQLLYVCIFLGVCSFGRVKLLHFLCLALSVLLCSVVATVQLFNIDILGLFPGDYSYYDSGIRYSSAFLGTIGNTNVLSAFFCLSLPVLFLLPVLSKRKLAWLGIVALLPTVFVLIRARVAGGFVGLGLCALVAAPLVLTDINTLRRCLLAASPLCLSAAIALALNVEYSYPIFQYSFSFGLIPLMAIGAGLVFAAAAILLRGLRVCPSPKTLRIFWLILCLALIIVGLLFVYFFPPAHGTVYELSQLLHGNIDDKFGSSRIRIWREALALFKEYPIFGSGPDTLALRLDIEFSRFVPETGKYLRTRVDNAHNEYLGHLINTGIAGLASYLFLLIIGLRAFLKKLSKPLICAAGFGCLCYCIQSFFALGLPLIAPLFWIFLGLLFSEEETVPPNIMST